MRFRGIGEITGCCLRGYSFLFFLFFARFEPEGHFVFFPPPSLFLSLVELDGEFIGIDIGNDKLPSLIRDFLNSREGGGLTSVSLEALRFRVVVFS